MRCFHHGISMAFQVRMLAQVVIAESPLSELRGYSKRIRILTSGTATFSMEFSCYKLMSPLDQKKATIEITGIEM
jgi:elongation factor G